MHEYYRIKSAVLPMLANAGFVEEYEESHPDCFGSIHSVFSKSDRKVRLVWDGKDGWGVLQCQEGLRWIDLGLPVPESNEQDFAAHITRLCDALDVMLRQP